MNRPVKMEERTLIQRIADRLDHDSRKRLLADVDAASAKAMNDDGSLIQFDITGYNRPTYQGQHTYSAEGRMLDADGAEISVMLYADENNRLFELEFIRWADGGLRQPQWATLTIV